MNILITGASGFVGQNLTRYFINKNLLTWSVSLRNPAEIPVTSDTTAVVHLAGKAHDLKGTADEAAYFEVNTELTKRVYQAFCASNAGTFIFVSSVKAVADEPFEIVDEEMKPTPVTAYGRSKLAAEQHLLANQKPGTRLFILRPCMIHGPDNKGNLNLLYKLVSNKIPYPLGSFENQRSFLSVENLCFVITELIQNEDVKSDIYNVADDGTFSTNEVINLIGESLNRKASVWLLPRKFVTFIARMGDKLHLPLTSGRLQKLTETYVVSNEKIKAAIGKSLPVSGKSGLLSTFNSFKNK